jgi:hypothetical protein
MMKASAMIPQPLPSHPQAPPRSGELRYQNAYVWFVFAASLDIMLTWLILSLGGQELNRFASAIIRFGGLPAMIVFKFVVVTTVVLICEVVGRRNHELGRKVARLAVILTCLPPAMALAQLVLHLAGPAPFAS